MMASPDLSLRPTSTISSQTAGTPANNFTQIISQVSTPNVTATNGFRPSIPPKNSRVPAGEIDRLSSSSSSKLCSPLNGKSITSGISTLTNTIQPFSPPPLPHPPIKGISNAQARTARKSAPSTSNRGDGYSTSSSGGGGRRSISGSSSGKNNKERKDRESLSISESPNESPIAATTGFEGVNSKRSLQQQTPLPIPSKLQPQQQTQQMQQESHLSPQTDQKQQQQQQQQKEVMVSTVPAPPTFAGPSTQTAGTKRPASPTPISLSSKPKRQIIATAKAAALANEPLMNADGSAVKKRRPKGLATEKEKYRKAKNKEKSMAGFGMFPVADRPGPGEAGSSATIGITAKPVNAQPQRIPNPPPPYQVPAHLQKQSTLQGQQEKKDSSTAPLAVSNLLASGTGFGVQDVRVPTPPSGVCSKPQNSSVSVSSLQTPQRQSSNDVISVSSSPTDPREATQHQSEASYRLGLGEREQGNHQSTPITIDDVGSDDGDSAIGSRSPEENTGVEDDKIQKLESCKNDSGLTGPLDVSELLFNKCISVSTTDDERRGLIDRILKIINQLNMDASHARKVPPISGTGPDSGNENNSPTLQGKLMTLLEHVSVLAEDGTIITFNGWKISGMMKFKGKFILPHSPEVREASLGAEKTSSEIMQPEEPQPLKMPDEKEDGSGPKTGEGVVVAVEIVSKSSTAAATSCDSTPDCNGQEKVAGPPAEAKQKENCAPATGTVQLAGTISPPPEPLNILPPEKPVLQSQAAAQSQVGQEPPSPSNQIQAEAGASTAYSALTPGVAEAQVPSPVSGKRKRKVFTRPTVQDFLKELPSQRVSSFSIKQQGRNDPLLVRIIGLNQEEVRIRDEMDAIAAAAGKKEREFARRIDNARIGSKAMSNGDQDLNTGLNLEKNLAECPVNWGEYREAIKELRDFQYETRQEELRLADKATRVAEEKGYYIERRKRLRQIEYELEATSSSRTSEERSVGTSGSTAPTTAPSSVAGSSDDNQLIPPPVGMNIGTGFPELSVGQELLRSMIPWAKQPQEVSLENPQSVSTEAAANQAKSKKRPTRRKKHW